MIMRHSVPEYRMGKFEGENMDVLKIRHTDRKNIGDSINPYIIEEVFGVPFENAGCYDCDMTGIGSGLSRFFFAPRSLGGIKELIRGRLNPKPLVIWSAGFITTPTGKEKSLRWCVDVVSVRGEFSRKWLETLLGRSITCTTGDAGLLANEVLHEEVKKEYAVGIIPHDRDRNDPLVAELRNALPDCTVIDVTGEVIPTLRQIASCRTIISSSLHGLIISDSFGIPNMHIKISDRLVGDGFKFQDYYSSYGMCDEVVDIRQGFEWISEQSIQAHYRISHEAVAAKKAMIKEAFSEAIKRCNKGSIQHNK